MRILFCFFCSKELKEPYEQFEIVLGTECYYFCEEHFKKHQSSLSNKELIKKIQDKTGNLCWGKLDVWLEILEERFKK